MSGSYCCLNETETTAVLAVTEELIADWFKFSGNYSTRQTIWRQHFREKPAQSGRIQGQSGC